MRTATALLLMLGFASGSAFAGAGCIYSSDKEITETEIITEVPTTVEIPTMTEGDAT